MSCALANAFVIPDGVSKDLDGFLPQVFQSFLFSQNVVPMGGDQDKGMVKAQVVNCRLPLLFCSGV